MKKSDLAALVGLCFLYATSAQAQFVEEKFDRFRSTTTWSSPPAGVFVQQGLQWGAKPTAQFQTSLPGPSGNPEKTAATASILLMATNRVWQFASCHSVRLLADGKPVATLATHYSSQPVNRSISEIIVTDLTIESLRQLAAANLIEGQLCSTEFKVSSDAIRGLKEIIFRFDALPR